MSSKSVNFFVIIFFLAVLIVHLVLGIAILILVLWSDNCPEWRNWNQLHAFWLNLIVRSLWISSFLNIQVVLLVVPLNMEGSKLMLLQSLLERFDSVLNSTNALDYCLVNSTWKLHLSIDHWAYGWVIHSVLWQARLLVQWNSICVWLVVDLLSIRIHLLLRHLGWHLLLGKLLILSHFRVKSLVL